jgi:chromosome partitioning protein
MATSRSTNRKIPVQTDPAAAQAVLTEAVDVVDKAMRVPVPRIACANQSGGSCKTTTAVALAAEAARRGQRVLFVDLNAQGDGVHQFGYPFPDRLCGSCGQIFDVDANGRPERGCEAEGGGRHEPVFTIYDVLLSQGKISITEALLSAVNSDGTLMLPGPEVDGQPTSLVHVVLSSSQLTAAESQLSNILGAQGLLDKALSTIESNYDLIVIDCPGAFGQVMSTIMMAATDIIACVKPGLKEIKALTQLEDTIHVANTVFEQDSESRRLALAGVLIGDAFSSAQGKAYGDAINLVLSQYPQEFLPQVGHSVRVVEAYAHGQPVSLFAPRSSVTAQLARVFVSLVDRGVVSPKGVKAKEVLAMRQWMATHATAEPEVEATLEEASA